LRKGKDKQEDFYGLKTEYFNGGIRKSGRGFGDAE